MYFARGIPNIDKDFSHVEADLFSLGTERFDKAANRDHEPVHGTSDPVLFAMNRRRNTTQQHTKPLNIELTIRHIRDVAGQTPPPGGGDQFAGVVDPLAAERPSVPRFGRDQRDTKLGHHVPTRRFGPMLTHAGGSLLFVGHEPRQILRVAVAGVPQLLGKYVVFFGALEDFLEIGDLNTERIGGHAVVEPDVARFFAAERFQLGHDFGKGKGHLSRVVSLRNSGKSPLPFARYLCRMRLEHWLALPICLGCSPSDVPEPTDTAAGDTASRDTDTNSDAEPQSRAAEYTAHSVETTIATGSMRSSAVAWNGTRWITVYTNVVGTHNVYASTITPNGNALEIGPSLRVDDNYFDAFEAEIAIDDTGRSLVVFEDDRVGLGTCCREIYARFLDPEGVPQGTSFNLVNHPETEEYTPAVAWDSDTWYVTWSDDREYTGNDERLLYGRTVSADGALGDELRIGGDSRWQVYGTVVDSGGTGSFLVVWGDYDPVNGTLDAGYRARVIGTDGAPQTEVIEIVRHGNLLYDRPSAAYHPWKKAWLVTWTTPYKIYGAWVFPDGSTEHLGALVDTEIGAGASRLTYAAATNSFVLGWHAWWTNDGFVTALGADGLPATDAMSVNASTPPLGSFYIPVAAADDGSVLATPSLDYNRITASWYRIP